MTAMGTPNEIASHIHAYFFKWVVVLTFLWISIHGFSFLKESEYGETIKFIVIMCFALT